MLEYLLLPMIAGFIVLIIVIAIVFFITSNHSDFINNANKITNGMTKNEVLNIMQETPTSKEVDGEKTILIWEKNQWKGIQNGGTVTRSVKVTIEDDRVISVSTKNLDKSTFW